MNSTIAAPARAGQDQWLKTYYFTRAGFSILWVLAAVGAGAGAAASALLMLAYPAWDALANLMDARRSGGLQANRTQFLNVVASAVVTAAVALSLPDMHRVLAVFGVWAILSGVLQLATGWRRRKTAGAQWAMLLSGAQSALAGGFFIVQAGGAAEPTAASVAGYAGFGAFYFLVSALVLSFKARRRASIEIGTEKW
jgi:hypothetical protein